MFFWIDSFQPGALNRSGGFVRFFFMDLTPWSERTDRDILTFFISVGLISRISNINFAVTRRSVIIIKNSCKIEVYSRLDRGASLDYTRAATHKSRRSLRSIHHVHVTCAGQVHSCSANHPTGSLLGLNPAMHPKQDTVRLISYVWSTRTRLASTAFLGRLDFKHKRVLGDISTVCYLTEA